MWVLPDATTFGPAMTKARAFRTGATITNISDVYGGSLDEVLAVPQPPADPDAVAALARYLTAPPASAKEAPG